MYDLGKLSKGELYALRLEVQNYIDQFENAAFNSLKLGIPVKDYELKKGRKSRKIDNEQELVAELTAAGVPFGELYDSKLKGIPALEKTMREDKSLSSSRQFNRELILKNHILVTEGNPSLVFTGSVPSTKE
jgi:hypothetical protein